MTNKNQWKLSKNGCVEGCRKESIELDGGWVGALVTNDQPSYFQPTPEMAHSIAWEMAQFKGPSLGGGNFLEIIIICLWPLVTDQSNPPTMAAEMAILHLGPFYGTVWFRNMNRLEPGHDLMPASLKKGLRYQTFFFPSLTPRPLFYPLLPSSAFIRDSKWNLWGWLIDTGFEQDPFQQICNSIFVWYWEGHYKGGNRG